jgi:hypothetical protein
LSDEYSIFGGDQKNRDVMPLACYDLGTERWSPFFQELQNYYATNVEECGYDIIC